ncbi:carbohydrate ABC transporter permease [Paenibacillus eucommiae]|uniref:Raffinose/stachyose/melibiose transport system permease protein n=1 Tax=Paenibacillus eucommiae TaxID=1355755 RepID=A0ABS4IRG0_9BACL|nr:carbohydrate ABC transporter permease [Paenibacillus eucommiae]MBP1990156.1 raffinose/stachyose/melibiose transport system permease protein [Paenibacillus eucommiae]
MTLKSIGKIFIYVAIALLLVIYLLPIYFIVITSLKSTSEASVLSLSLPKEWIFDNYRKVFVEGNLLRPLANGAFISLTVVGITMLLSSVTAFVIQRRKSGFSTFMYKYLLAGLIAPFSIIPAIKLLQVMHLMGTYTGLILIDVACALPFNTLLFAGFIKGIPKDLDEAGIIDGAKPIRLFFQIIFPLLKPAIATNFILLFTSIWNDFQNVLYFLPDSKKWTMPMTIYDFQGLHTNDYSLVFADMIFLLLPVIIIFLLAQKYIVTGMVAGAIKG